MHRWPTSQLAIIASLTVLLGLSPTSAAESRTNVLFIAVDDLRPELRCYGAAHIHSPNIDALAASGRLFERAYCQQAVCNPSRTSLMTGMRPDSIGVTGNHSHFRSHHPDVITLPQHFKNHDYHAAAIGKIYHGVFPDGASNTKWDTMGDPESWSVPAVRFGPRYYYTEEGITAAKRIYEKVYKPKNPGPDDWMQKLVFGPATESPDVPDSTLYDGQVADAAVKTLQELKNKDKPFFLAVGFIKPHSPYIAPKKYFDLYDNVPLPSHTEFPADAPSFAGHGSGELRRYTDQPKQGVIPDEKQRRVRQAYFACISYIDAQIGRVLNELERSGLTNNTIVVLYGDHGYHLGEQGLWGKTTNFELDARVPLIVRAPGMKAAGKSSSSLVELVDLYPTLADLAGLPVTGQLEGKSFAPILTDPVHVTKTVALSQYPRGGGLMGYSIRTSTHRLTQWVHRQSGEIRATELYDYGDGPVESKNIASTSPEVVEKLSRQLVTAFASSFVSSPLPHQAEKVRVGLGFLSHVTVHLGDNSIKLLRLTVTSPPNTGILIDDIRIAPARPQKIVGVEVVPLTLPALVGNDASPLLKLNVETTGQLNPISLTEGSNCIWIACQLSKSANIDNRVGAACKLATSIQPRKSRLVSGWRDGRSGRLMFSHPNPHEGT